jgi:hypothetical protein
MDMHLTVISKTTNTFCSVVQMQWVIMTTSEIDTQFFSDWTYLKKPGLQSFIQQHIYAKQLIWAVTRNKVGSC